MCKGREMFRKIKPKKEDKILSGYSWRELAVGKMIIAGEGNNLHQRFFASKERKRIYPNPEGYYFDLGTQTVQDDLIVIFIVKQGIKTKSSLDNKEGILQEAVILERGKEPKYAYCQDLGSSKEWNMQWQMLPEGRDSTNALKSAFSAMEKSVLFGSEYSVTSWKGRMTDMSGIRALLQQ